jgi:hypothetical protein
MRKFALVLLSLGLAVSVQADWVNNNISVTTASSTITLDSCSKNLFVKNTGATNALYVCPWKDNESVLACTTTIGRQLDAGEGRSWSLGLSSARCFKSISVITSTSTTTARGDSLP